MWQQPLPHWEAGDDVFHQVRRAESLKIAGRWKRFLLEQGKHRFQRLVLHVQYVHVTVWQGEFCAIL
jgi:hypothetical protein